MSALFDVAGQRYVATELSRGPWDPRHCHGGPVAALLARAVEGADGGGGEWQVARLSVELTRPVPVGVGLELSVEVERPGRKVSLVAAALIADGTEVARVRALRIRAEPVDLPGDAHLAGDTPLGPVGEGALHAVEWATEQGLVAFHSHSCEHRWVTGSWAEPGPCSVWIRLLHPVLEGEEPSGVQRVIAAADFGNGVSGSLPSDDFVFINPDLTVYLLRPPVGEWVGMRTASRYGHLGAGLAESELFDADGRLGRSAQSLFVDAR